MKSFIQHRQTLISENKGFAYEKELHKRLDSFTLAPHHFNPAGAGHGPDGMFMFRGREYGYEIKLSERSVDYGQVELRYRNGAWMFGGKNEEAKELYTGLGVLDFVYKHWGDKGAPRRETVSSKDMTFDDRKYDYAQYKDGFMKVPTSFLHDHYARKGVFYIQIGKKGFYHLKNDIANIGTPQYNPSLKLRLRIKGRASKRTKGYGFLTALILDKGAVKSKYDMDGNLDFLRK